MSAWELGVANQKVLEVQKLGKRVMARRFMTNSVIATKENRFPGQPVKVSDWQIVALNDNDDPIPAVENGQPIYIYRDSDGNLAEYSEKYAAALHREPLYDTWLNDQSFFLSHYEVDQGELMLGIAVARSNATVNYAIQLTEETEIETNWGTAKGSHWLVAYNVDPATLQIVKYDFNIVDADAAARTYKLVGTAVPSKK